MSHRSVTATAYKTLNIRDLAVNIVRVTLAKKGSFLFRFVGQLYEIPCRLSKFPAFVRYFKTQFKRGLMKSLSVTLNISLFGGYKLTSTDL